MKISSEVLKTRAGDDRVCHSTTSFFNNKKNIMPARAGDDRVCHSTTSFFEKNKEALNVRLNNDIEKEIFEARSTLS